MADGSWHLLIAPAPPSVGTGAAGPEPSMVQGRQGLRNCRMRNPIKDKEETYSLEGKGYTGRANRHLVMIKREPEAIYKILTNPYQMKEWVPFEQITVEKVTVGEFDLGTRVHFKLNFRIQPEWDVEVIHLERPKRIVNQFTNGIFKGGIEIWDLKETDSGTEVAHTLVYKIHRWIYRIGWCFLGGERKHNELTELALSRLKALLEGGS